MKVIVTGACGFMGSHLVDELIKQGYEVIATDLESASKKFLNSQALFMPADLASDKDIIRLFSHPSAKEASWLFHVAAVFDYFQSYNVLYRNNVIGTFNLIREFAKSPAKNRRLLLWSSAGMYGNTAKTVSADEDFPLNPNNDYTRSKFEQERILRSFLKINPDAFEAIILRIADTLGPRSRYGAIKMLEFIAGGQMQFYLSKKNLISTVVHVEDVIGAAIYLAKININRLQICSNGIPTFNAVDNSRYTHEELIDYIATLMKPTHNSRILKFHLPSWLIRLIGKWQEFLAQKHGGRPKFSSAFTDFLEKPLILNNFRLLATGYELKWPDTKKSISDTIKWYLKEGWL